ncbi:MAG TPA: type III effector [Nocardioidaceae bacterium]|nr:type III effector [Nocardioidaceae bacterium]
MRNQTSVRKGLIRGAAVATAAAASIALSLPAGSAAATTPDASTTVSTQDGQRMSPDTKKAWSEFVRGGGNIVGGTAHVIAGAWVGVPAIAVSATGGELTPDQKTAWRHFEYGANHAGEGVARVVSSIYVGAPGYILDQIRSGATPSDLSRSELDQVSFLVPLSELVPSQLNDLF